MKPIIENTQSVLIPLYVSLLSLS